MYADIPEYAGYLELVGSFARVLLAVEDNDYQGDSRLLLADTGRVGLLFFGWGSCSGCDALEAARDDGVDAVRALRDELAGQVHWEDGPVDLIRYIQGKDWSLDFRGSDPAMQAFLSRAMQILRDLAEGRTDINSLTGGAVPAIGSGRE